MINKTITIDLWKPTNQPVSIVQHEAEGRTLYFQLTSGSLPVNLTACDVVFYAKKPDGTILFNDCVLEDDANGQISYLITGQTCVVAGELECWIIITSATSQLLRTQKFTITVEESDDVSGAVESTSEFTDLTVALVTLAARSVPAGAITEYAGSTAPDGWLLCDGAAVSRETYAALYAIVGTTYGAGDGSTTFNVPNLKGRTPVGKDTAQGEFDTLGETGGTKTHTLTRAQLPNVNLDVKTRNGFNTSFDAGSTSGVIKVTWDGGGVGAAPGASGDLLVPLGDGEAHPNLQPYIILNYIIKF